MSPCMDHTKHILTHLASGDSVFHPQSQTELLQLKHKKGLETLLHSLLLQCATLYFLT